MFLAFTRRNRVPEQNTNLPRLLGRKLSPSAVVFCSHGLAWVPGSSHEWMLQVGSTLDKDHRSCLVSTVLSSCLWSL